MGKRYLGKQRLEVSALGLGCMTLCNGFENPTTRKEMERLILRAYDLGVTMFDTAEIYGPFQDEILVGEALKSIRNEVVIATKCGIHLENGQQVVDTRPEVIRASVEGSLKRLQTEYIDLYYVHRIDPKVAIEEVAETMKQLHQEGKIRAWVLAQKPWIVPIPGTTKISRMEENMGAARVKLSPEELGAIQTLLDKFQVAGERYTPGSEMARRVRL